METVTGWTAAEREALVARITALDVLTDEELITEAARAAKEAIRWNTIGLAVTKQLNRRGVIDLKNPRALRELVDSRHDLIPEVGR